MWKEFWHKINTAEIKFGKPPKIKTPEEQFLGTIQAVVILGFGILVSIAAGPLLQVLKVGKELVFVVGFVSLCVSWMAYGAIVLGIGAQPLDFWSKFYAEPYRIWWAQIPILRQILFLWKPFEPKQEVRLMALTALGAWSCWGIFGLANVWAVALMSVSCALALHLQGKYLKIRLPDKLKFALWGLLFSATLLLGFGMLYQVELRRDVARETAKLRERGVPLDGEAALKHYYNGVEPDAEYSALVEEKPDFDALKIRDFEYLYDAEKREALIDCLNSAAFQKCAAYLDRRMEENAILKYRLKPQRLILDWKLPQLNFNRMMVYGYRWRIIRAAERGDRAEAMRLLGLLTQFQETLLDEPQVVGHLVALRCEAERQAAIARLLGLNILNSGDITEIAAMERDRESKLRQSAIRGMVAETAMQYQLFSLLLFSPVEFLKQQDPKAASPQEWKIAKQLMGKTMQEHPFAFGRSIQNLLQIKHMLRWNSLMLDTLSDPTDYSVNPERFAAPEKYREEFCNTLMMEMLLSALSKYLITAESGIARARMCRTALEMECDRLTLGHLHIPKAPVNPMTGEPFEFASGQVQVWRTVNNREIADTFSGWQLSGLGRNASCPAAETKKSLRVTFTVITDPPPQKASARREEER